MSCDFLVRKLWISFTGIVVAASTAVEVDTIRAVVVVRTTVAARIAITAGTVVAAEDSPVAMHIANKVEVAFVAASAFVNLA